MNAAMLIVLIIAVPVVLFPAAFIWYLNFGGILQAIRQTRARKA